MTQQTKAMLNKWSWQYLGFKRKQYPVEIEVFKKSRKAMIAFWAGILLGFLPYIVHQSGVLV
jgi:hypothetical protein